MIKFDKTWDPPIIAYGSKQEYNRSWHLNSGIEPIIIKGTNWEHDISQEDFTQYDYVELNGVRFNRAETK